MSEIFESPMRELILTLSAWRRLKTKAKELASDPETKFAGLYMLNKMNEAYDSAEREMEEEEKLLTVEEEE